MYILTCFRFHIGLNLFTWWSSNDDQLTWSKWLPGKPDGVSTCVAVVYVQSEDSYYYDDQPCDEEYNYLCETPANGMYLYITIALSVYTCSVATYYVRISDMCKKCVRNMITKVCKLS